MHTLLTGGIIYSMNTPPKKNAPCEKEHPLSPPFQVCILKRNTQKIGLGKIIYLVAARIYRMFDTKNIDFPPYDFFWRSVLKCGTP
mmetsp:Transcript_9194/g.12781  ORF Transcript_9194/g.12781 Transcript_9194/m.12781 type:complete len:86 (-) Transcript_9194:17-274(-)